VLSRVAKAFVVRRRVGTRISATRLLINQRIARGICRSRIEYRLLAAVEHLIWSMLTWSYFSDDLRVPVPYVDAGSFDLSSASLWGRPRKFVVDNFPLSISCRSMSIRGIGIDRKFRWTGFGPGAVICLCWKHARDLIQYDD
jgi:hypothetical protein